ncbi:MAG: hypothetical protein ABSB42_13810 [Tepidisphaeraceae bacterium]|jgi:hypothetical protein
MGQVMHNPAADEGRGHGFLRTGKTPTPTLPLSKWGGGKRARLTDMLPALAAAIVCTGLIAEAILTAVHGRSNGDLMVSVIPILGAVFLSIPTGQAWWGVIRSLKRR